MFSRQREERLAIFRLYVCRIDDRQFTGGETLGGNEVQHLERIFSGRLVRFVVADQTSIIVRREHFGRLEVIPGERGFAGARRADEHD